MTNRGVPVVDVLVAGRDGVCGCEHNRPIHRDPVELARRTKLRAISQGAHDGGRGPFDPPERRGCRAIGQRARPLEEDHLAPNGHCPWDETRQLVHVIRHGDVRERHRVHLENLGRAFGISSAEPTECDVSAIGRHGSNLERLRVFDEQCGRACRALPQPVAIGGSQKNALRVRAHADRSGTRVEVSLELGHPDHLAGLEILEVDVASDVVRIGGVELEFGLDQHPSAVIREIDDGCAVVDVQILLPVRPLRPVWQLTGGLDLRRFQVLHVRREQLQRLIEVDRVGGERHVPPVR